MKKIYLIIGIIGIIAFLGTNVWRQIISRARLLSATSTSTNQNEEEVLDSDASPIVESSLSIAKLRESAYPESKITIEQTLDSGSNYARYLASYQSEGNKIYALLTVPRGAPPKSGWPAIIFNHGYIPPAEYRTTERYIAYVDGFARNGYMVLRPDYRGHGDSEGKPSGAYGSNNYTIDVLHATSALKEYEGVDPKRIGMWGHSMGGFITLRSMVSRNDIKAGVIWAGVVGSYPDLLNNWRRSNASPPPGAPTRTPSWRSRFTTLYGSPEENPSFWNSISANSYLADISGSIQLHHGTADTSVPVAFSQTLAKQMQTAGKKVELYTYAGDDHNIANSFNTAMQRSVDFFDRYVKGDK